MFYLKALCLGTLLFNQKLLVKITSYINLIDYIYILDQMGYWSAQQIYIEGTCRNLMTPVIKSYSYSSKIREYM